MSLDKEKLYDKLSKSTWEIFDFFDDMLKEIENNEEERRLVQEIRDNIWDIYHKNGMDFYKAVPIDDEEE